MATKITPEQAREIIHTGKFVTVTFRKRDESIRVMNGRTGVAKYVKGEAGKGRAYDFDEHGIVNLYETKNEAEEPSAKYRSVRLASLISVKAEGEEYEVVQPV